MNIVESFHMALKALRANLMRSLLTMLGIIVGVSSIIALLAFGTGYGQFLDQELRRAGDGVLYLFPGSSERRINAQQRPQLTLGDALALREPGAAPAIRTTSAIITEQALISAEQHRGNYTLLAVEPTYYRIIQQQLSSGRVHTEAEEEGLARVAIIGSTIAERFFGSQQAALGQRISINGVAFEVIGINTTRAGITGEPRKSVIIPYQSGRNWLYRNQFDRQVDVSQILVQARNRQSIDLAIRQTTEILRERHRLTYQANDFTVLNLEQISQQIGSIITGFNTFLGVVAGIALVVGGIGITNMMLITVSERTREIGLRKAVGARRIDILLQFLIEAITLSLVGALIGILIGWACTPLSTLLLQGMASNGLSDTSTAQAVVTWPAIGIAAGAAILISLVFGFFPAWQAAQLRPIEALRTE